MSPAQERLIWIKEKESGATVSSICIKYKITRATFYKWWKRYKNNPELTSLQNQYINGYSHWKAISLNIERLINDYVISNPQLSVHKLRVFLQSKGIKISSNGLHNILRRAGLNKKEYRISRKNSYFLEPIDFISKTSPEFRYQFIQKAINNGENISSICRRYNISRGTFYKWLKRFKREEIDYKKALSSRFIKGESHYRSIPEYNIEKLLDFIVLHPDYSVHRLSREINFIGHCGIQNILERKRLSKYEDRLSYSRLASIEKISPVTPKPTYIPIYNMALRLYRMILAPFMTIPKIGEILQGQPKIPLYFFSTFIVTFFFSSYWIYLLRQSQSSAQAIGLLFASVALTVGTFFFLYSLKYYITVALVLGFSRQTKEEETNKQVTSNNEQVTSGKSSSFLDTLIDKILGREGRRNNNTKTPAGGLQPDISKVTLSREPFVSIHLASYNEKRVLDRLLTAVTSMNYPTNNYEVILVDDSNEPEAQGVVNSWKGHPNLKIVQRTERTGFKGGALEEARKVTDRRAEFVLVFDADFIPYPDTITQFLKYFKAVGGWREEDIQTDTKRRDTKILGEGNRLISQYPNIPVSSNIAAIQGYQWHVLNKSENWITRGVRSEYAGSYVVERSGTEIYGGLKQIAGSVYMIKREILDSIGWGVSITEDFELTLKLYEKGYKVVYTPYLQAPSECVSTLQRLIRQRMRWAEGHSHNIKRMFTRLLFGNWEERSDNNSLNSNDQLLISNYSNQIPNPKSTNPKLGQLEIGNLLLSLSLRNWNSSISLHIIFNQPSLS